MKITNFSIKARSIPRIWPRTRKSASGRSLNSQTSTPRSRTSLDKKGDVWLVVKRNTGIAKFRVSTRVLSIASRFFDQLFDDKLEHGNAALSRPQKCPEIVLKKESHPVAMNILLSMLHHRRPSFPAEPSLLLAVVNRIRKYACEEVLAPWLMMWSNHMDDVGVYMWQYEDFILAVRTAEMLEACLPSHAQACGIVLTSSAKDWAMRAACHMSRHDLEKENRPFASTILDYHMGIRSDMEDIIEATLETLEQDYDVHECLERSACPDCGRAFTAEETEEEHWCDHAIYNPYSIRPSLVPKACGKQWRVKCFLEITTRMTWSTHSLEDDMRSMEYVLRNPPYCCDAFQHCSLARCIEQATEDFERRLSSVQNWKQRDGFVEDVRLLTFKDNRKHSWDD